MRVSPQEPSRSGSVKRQQEINPMSRFIEARDGAEIYANETGWVCIKQESRLDPDAVVTIHPDDIPQLIDALEEVRGEAYQIRHDPAGGHES